MKGDFLLDTHTVLWFLQGDSSISSTIVEEIINPVNKKYVSVASIWEVAIKITIHKLQFDGGVKEFVRLLHSNGFAILPILPVHIFELEHLPMIHRDPFDRIIIASAMAENMTIISKDNNFAAYNVRCVF